MDPSLVSEPGGFLTWVSTYGNVVFFFAQIIFWAGILLFTGYAVVQYKRWVNFQMGVGKSGALRDKAADKGSDKKVSVDKFVE